MLSVAGPWLLNKLYSFTKLMRTAGLFAADCEGGERVAQVSRERGDSSSDPPKEVSQFSKEMMSYLRTHFKRFVKSGSERQQRRQLPGIDVQPDSGSESDGEGPQEPQDRGTLRYHRDLEAFFAMWNGTWWEDGVVHYCSGRGCCANRGATIDALARSAEAVLFKSNIPTIAANKWTKLGPVLDWILGASLAHSILPAAFGKLGLGSLQAAAGGSNSSLAPANEYLDPALESDLTFSVMKGKRFKASLELLRDKERLATMWMFALAIEPLRYLSAWWMRRARETDRSPSRIPLFDMLLPECSPLQAARQYVATLGR